MKRNMTSEEISFVKEIIGYKYKDREINFSKITIEETGRYKNSFSLPTGRIITEDVPTMINFKNKSILVHEVFHQFQYQAEGLIAVQKLWISLERMIGNKAYEYELEAISVLDDIKKYEARAQFVEDFTFSYVQYDDAKKKGNIAMLEGLENEIIPYAKILFRSDFSSKAVEKFGK
jgi:hypothetical protein